VSPSRAAALAFVTASVTLFAQVLLHRIVAAKFLNNFAFLVISLGMLGFALSGVALTRWLRTLLARLPDAMSACGALFALSTVGSAALVSQLAECPAASSRAEFLLAILQTLPSCLLLALPFFFSGMMLGLLLADPALPTTRIYACDLVGSAVGAALVVPSLSAIGVERALLAACGALLAATLVLLPPRRRLPRALAALGALSLLGAFAAPERLFAMSYPAWTVLGWVKRLPPPNGLEFMRWDPIARIEVSRIAGAPSDGFGYRSLIGSNHAFHARFRRILTQNNFAYTFAVDYDGTPSSLVGIEETIYAAAYQADTVARPKVLTIGVGGGFDVLTALAFHASGITGVEINAATVEVLTHVYRPYFRHWVEDPRVRLVAAEGRHFLATDRESYDVIQLSGVDSYAGTAAAAHVFSENYLYTLEAFELYLARLSPNGVLNMMRLEQNPPREMLRALITAVEALRRAGVSRPEDHVVTLSDRNGRFTALLVKRSPFTPAEVQRLVDWSTRGGLFEVTASPGANVAGANNYQRFLRLEDPRLGRAFVRSAPFEIEPVSDDRPFFFKYSRWSHIFSDEPAVVAATPVMEYSLLLLLAMVGTVAVACVYLPLWFLSRGPERVPQRWRYAAFFAGLGVGYLAIEIALIQKFGLFLGHPNLALSVVLAALLFSSGLGSLVADRVTAALGHLRFVAYLLVGLLLAEHALVFPRLPGLLALPLAARIGVVCALVAPIGVCLGNFLPTGLAQLKRVAPGHAPWAWGINGIFSVVGPLLSIGLSMSWGISALLLSALPVYMMAGLILPASRPGHVPARAA
jgi:spermidine synthase